MKLRHILPSRHGHLVQGQHNGAIHRFDSGPSDLGAWPNSARNCAYIAILHVSSISSTRKGLVYQRVHSEAATPRLAIRTHGKALDIPANIDIPPTP